MMDRNQWRGWCKKAAADFGSRAFTVDAAAEVWTAWWNEAKFLRAYQLRRGLSKSERAEMRRTVREAERCKQSTLENLHPHVRRAVAAEMRKRGWRYIAEWREYDRYGPKGLPRP